MLFIDGLVAGAFTRDTLLQMQAGDVACTTVTCGFWDDPTEGFDAIARWRDLAGANSDIARLAYCGDDIVDAASAGQCALLLGFQNTSQLGGRTAYVEFFAELGIRVMQLTYNVQNDVGSSCYEPSDVGLSRFGREVVHEMARCGVLVDLSHVGERTGLDAIDASPGPVAITHANPVVFYEHPRNKSTEILKALVARGGVVGLAIYRNIAGGYADSPRRFAELIARTVELVGIDGVAIGTDQGGASTPGHYRWMRNGRWTRGAQYGAGKAGAPPGGEPVPWYGGMDAFPTIAEALERTGMASNEIEAVMGNNWLGLYQRVFKAKTDAATDRPLSTVAATTGLEGR
jgi:microsomal dipeptidase-like Zn-dependent dipeptidase